MSNPTPDQPERCPTCAGEYGFQTVVKNQQSASGFSRCPDPFHNPQPSLHQRIEGLIAEFEERAALREQSGADGGNYRHIASRLRTVLKGDGDG